MEDVNRSSLISSRLTRTNFIVCSCAHSSIMFAIVVPRSFFSTYYTYTLGLNICLIGHHIQSHSWWVGAPKKKLLGVIATGFPLAECLVCHSRHSVENACRLCRLSIQNRNTVHVRKHFGEEQSINLLPNSSLPNSSQFPPPPPKPF